MPRLSEEVFKKIISLLEAEQAYNAILQELIEQQESTSVAGPSLSFLGVGASFPGFKEGVIADLLKEKRFFETYLQRFSTEDDQQKVLDELHEELRFGLHTVISSYHQTMGTPASDILRYYVKINIESLNNLRKAIEPHLSDLGKLLTKNKISYNKLSKKAGYHGEDLKTYKDDIQSKLEEFASFYERHNDQQGLKDIRERRAILKNPLELALEVGETPDDITLFRKTFYYLYHLLKKAEDLHKIRIESGTSSATSSHERTSVPTPKGVSETEAKTRKDLPASTFTSSRQEAPAEKDSAAPIPSQTTDSPSLITPPKPSATAAPVSPLSQSSPTDLSDSGSVSLTKPVSTPSMVRGEKSSHSPSQNQDLMDKAREVIQASSQQSSSSTSTTGATSEKPLTFSKKAAKPGKVKQDVSSPEIHPSAERKEKMEIASKGIIEKLRKPRFLKPLTDLFYGNLGKAKIEESSLQSILALIGVNLDDNREAVRRQLSFKGRIGFVPNSDSSVVKAHYHTTNQRYVAPGVLAHYRDFFHRIGLTPHHLWPKEYEDPGYHATKTTRTYASKGH